MKATAQFLAVHPVLVVKNVVKSLDFYVNKLGFEIAFYDLDKNGLTFYEDI